MNNSYTLEFTVAGDETDYSGRLFLDRLIDKLQIANYTSASLIGFTEELFTKKNVSWMILNNKIEFMKEMVKSGRKLIIETVATGIKGIKLFREDFIYIEEKRADNLLAHNGSVWILADIDTHMPKRPYHIIDKKEIEGKYEAEKTFAKNIENLKPIPDEKQKIKILEHQVSYSDIDLNRHMHNTHYIKMAIDAIAKYEKLDIEREKVIIHNLNIRYLKEILLNEKINLYIIKDRDYHIVEGITDKNEVSFIVKIRLRISSNLFE